MVDQLLDGLPCLGGQAGGCGVSHGAGGLGELVGAPEQGAGTAAYISTIGQPDREEGKTGRQPDRPRSASLYKFGDLDDRRAGLLLRRADGNAGGRRQSGRGRSVEWLPDVQVQRRDRPSLAPVRLRQRATCLLYTSSEPTRLGMISYAVFCLKKK